MELLDRYLHAVRFWLPEAQQHDIIAELSEDIRSQIEDRESELGRPLAEAELEALLRQRGRPMLVASRYLPQQHLIGPMFLPLYWFALKWVLLPIFVLIVGPLGVLAPTAPPAALTSFVWGLWRAAFYGFGIFTVVLALQEKYRGRIWFSQRRTPRYVRSLKRYTKAVKDSLPWLPKQQDIVAELSEDIRSQIEEKEAVLGRKLRKAELIGLLKQRGHPLAVAERFLPQQYLIGPEYFPIYRFVLKVVLLWILLPLFAVIVIPISVLTATHRGLALIKALWDSLFGALYTVGLLTLLFALLEHFQVKFEFLDRWTLSSLPAVQQPRPISRCQSISGLVLTAVLLSWWALMPHYPYLIFGPNAEHLKLTAAWPTYYWPVLLLLLGGMAHHAFNLLRPHATVSAALRRMLVNGAAAVVAFLFLRAYPYVAAADATQTLISYDSIAQTVNGAIQAAESIPTLARYEGMAQTFNVVIFSNLMIWVLWMAIAALASGIVCLWRLRRPVGQILTDQKI